MTGLALTWGFTAILLACVVGGLVLGAASVWLYGRWRFGGYGVEAQRVVSDAHSEADRLLKDADVDAKSMLLEAQQQQEAHAQERQQQLNHSEQRLRQRESNLERKNKTSERRERELKEREHNIQDKEDRTQVALQAAEQRVQDAREKLERVAGMSQQEAKQELLDAMQEKVRAQAAARIRTVMEEAEKQAHERSSMLIGATIQRIASDFVSEKTVSVVELPSDDMKGRIIGREGRNIRAIEAATGVDVVIDDTPEAVILSCFNPVRREVAKLALERLVEDGRIHPARIEEMVEKAEAAIDEQIQHHGEQALLDLGLPSMHAELVNLVGRLKYRVVNGQNVWNHSVETAVICGMLADELGLKSGLAKRAGLLHDIGKAVHHEVDGHHAHIAADHARRFGEKQQVVDAIHEHHESAPKTVLGVILQAADTLSKARPGARREVLDGLVKRLEELEKISCSFKGVEQAYAVQAGREVRVMVDPIDLPEQETTALAEDIAARIEDELIYPGEVRVTVIREARATEIAR